MKHSAPTRPRIVLVHGAGGGAWEWLRWLPVLRAHGFASRAIDLEPAAAGLAATTLADYQAQVDAAAAGAVVIGASLGGRLAWATPHAVARVLINPMPHTGLERPGHPGDSGLVRWSQTTFRSHQRALADAPDALKLRTRHAWRDESAQVLAKARQAWAASRPESPTLAMIALDDEELPVPAMLESVQMLGAECWTLPNETHLSPLLGRQAPRFADRVARWLHQSLNSSSRSPGC